MNIGVDLVKIERFKNKDLNFAKRFLSSKELNYFENKTLKMDTQTLASIWAIKEAIFKADNSYFNFSKIELTRENNQWLHQEFDISLSHEGDYVTAIALKKR
ncbi:holo-ACP synthase [Mycoplasmopsis columbina]|uniref:holo-ACP synthase n=1 Tax=Mycoplasmopsis columbina TaxID=114881 RepID=UPI0004A71861|nr:4'-phosphopantetheinyl transferase superfamily protein [Mycoplasmopsis columbina]VEU76636.1 Holo-[acyl-carrier protein]synthase [Mycoplasmopsis columbina]